MHVLVTKLIKVHWSSESETTCNHPAFIERHSYRVSSCQVNHNHFRQRAVSPVRGKKNDTKPLLQYRMCFNTLLMLYLWTILRPLQEVCWRQSERCRLLWQQRRTCQGNLFSILWHGCLERGMTNYTAKMEQQLYLKIQDWMGTVIAKVVLGLHHPHTHSNPFWYHFTFESSDHNYWHSPPCRRAIENAKFEPHVLPQWT